MLSEKEISPSLSLWTSFEATAALNLRILGLNYDLVKMNKMITIWCFLLDFYLNTHHPINHGRSLYIRRLPMD